PERDRPRAVGCSFAVLFSARRAVALLEPGHSIGPAGSGVVRHTACALRHVRSRTRQWPHLLVLASAGWRWLRAVRPVCEPQSFWRLDVDGGQPPDRLAVRSDRSLHDATKADRRMALIASDGHLA